MQPPAPKSILLSNHVETTKCSKAGQSGVSGRELGGGGGGDQWGVVSGLSKETTNKWALTNIFIPPSQMIPTTSEGIVVQALSVVSDQHLSHTSHMNTNMARGVCRDNSIKKVAKKRRKQNGGVHVEHTKSSNEFLRKTQESLRTTQGDSEEEELLPELLDHTPDDQEEERAAEEYVPKKGILVNSKAFNPADEESSMTSTTVSTTDTSNAHNNYTSSSANSSGNESSSNLHGYEDPGKPASQYGYEDPNKATNQYGYEDANAAAAPRKFKWTAKRRCSVTEYSLSAVHMAAAAAAAERLQRLHLTRSNLLQSNPSAAAAIAAAASQRFRTSQTTLEASPNCQSSFGKMGSDQVFELGAQLPRSRRSLEREEKLRRNNSNGSRGSTGPEQQNSQTRRNRRSSNDGDNTMMAPSARANSLGNTNDSSTDVSNGASTVASNIYGYEVTDVPSRDSSGASENISNHYGYEDTDVTGKASRSAYGYEDPDATKDNPLGYVDDPGGRQRPRRRRPQRRGSVTKYSFQAAKAVATVQNGIVLPDETDPVVAMNVDQIEQAASLSPVVRPGPEMPVRKKSPYFQSKVFKSTPSLSSHSLGQPSEHAPPGRDASFRTNRSDDVLSSSDDEEDNESIFSSDGESLGESIISITIPLKEGDRVMRPPTRHDSFRSYASKGSSHSVRTFDSDAESLAPDMQSLCSISQIEKRTVDATHSLLPAFLPATPTHRSQSRKLMSYGTTPTNGLVKEQYEMISPLNDGGSGVRAMIRHEIVSIPFDAFALPTDASPLPSPMVQPRLPCAKSILHSAPF